MKTDMQMKFVSNPAKCVFSSMESPNYLSFPGKFNSVVICLHTLLSSKGVVVFAVVGPHPAVLRVYFWFCENHIF